MAYAISHKSRINWRTTDWLTPEVRNDKLLFTPGRPIYTCPYLQGLELRNCLLNVPCFTYHSVKWPGLDMPWILLKERGAFRNADMGGAWQLSVQCQHKLVSTLDQSDDHTPKLMDTYNSQKEMHEKVTQRPRKDVDPHLKKTSCKLNTLSFNKIYQN